MDNNKKTYLFANWKMYLDLKESQQMAKFYLNQLKNTPANIKTVVFPTSLAFNDVKAIVKDNLELGAQNCYWIDKGGYTGEVSAQMMVDAGAKYTLVGHSERRHQFGETNEDVRRKLEAVLATSLIPVLCIGETKQERNSEQSQDVITVQLLTALSDLAWPLETPLIVAYEPVWAISKGGVGVSCSLEETEHMHQIISDIIKSIQPESKLSLIYGGSVRPENISGYLNSSLVDGVLVGAASSQKESWEGLVGAVSSLSVIPA